MIRNLLDKLSTNLLKDSKYKFNGIPVPRTTEILSSMLHEDYLMSWANAIGLYQKKKYNVEVENASSIGTSAHNFIEDYIRNNVYNLKDSNIKDIRMLKMVETSVESFILWYSNISKNNTIEIINMEQELVCPWFGGTYDLLIKINGKIYLVDFKTSNHVSYKYCLQIAAYKFMLNNYYNIKIDGAIILQVDKKVVAYEEYVIDLSDEQHSKFIDLCTETYLSLVYSYYNRIKVEKEYKNIFS